ncbi:MAG TPA: winged helix DNA-binding domain-containing protein [Candidatus Limnocylindria bacterium]|nr:winged helix DNA-binding domain-containing protein [Candidatus Limnocylindria bacterium]
MTTPRTLDDAALNRATLARQLLLERASMSPYDAISHLVGLQAQTATSWYLTLWSRLRDFDPAATGRLLMDRRIVRSWFMRATIHTVTDEDAPVLRAFTQPTIDRAIRGKWAQALAGIDLAEMQRTIRDFVTTPRTPGELVAHLAERWPGPDSLTMTNAAKAIVPLVQVPPRGVWNRAGMVRFAAMDDWLDRPVPPKVDPAPILRRYLAAYGPASAADAQVWSGVTRLGEVFDRMRDELVIFRDSAGRELYDLPDAPRPDSDTPAPPRFLADYDNLLLSHADRSRFATPGLREALTYRSGPIPGALLVDGRMVGAWHLRTDGALTTVVIGVAQPLAPDDEAAVRAEADAMLEFSRPAAGQRAVEIGPIRSE